MIRVVIAPDKFRGSLSAPEAARAIARGVLLADSAIHTDEVPMADGGEGTLTALVAATSGQTYTVEVKGPLGAPVQARFGVLGDGITAVIEMAEASGLALVPADRRDPARATTEGTGQLVRAALDRGARKLILGIGGSATNDGGAGLARALGYRFLDRDGEPLGDGGGELERLDRIDASQRDPRLGQVAVAVACDVDNPLCGPHGASAVYGPQKGANSELIQRLDANLARLATVIERDLGVNVRELPGAGAAGGLGAGLVAFASGILQPGVNLVIETVHLADRLQGADLCVTGEGAIDASSAFGKTAVGVARQARKQACPTIALAGALGAGYRDVLREGINAVYSLCPGPLSLEDALKRAPELLANAAEQAMRGFLAGRGSARMRNLHE